MAEQIVSKYEDISELQPIHEYFKNLYKVTGEMCIRDRTRAESRIVYCCQADISMNSREAKSLPKLSRPSTIMSIT